MRSTARTKELVRNGHMVIVEDTEEFTRCTLTGLHADCVLVEFHIDDKVFERKINRHDAIDITYGEYTNE